MKMRYILLLLILSLMFLLPGCTTKIVYVPYSVDSKYNIQFKPLEYPKSSSLEDISLSYGNSIDAYNSCSIYYNNLSQNVTFKK